MNILHQKQTNGKPRLDYIDALRGLAALMVLVCHSPQVDPSLHLPHQMAGVFETCKYGVQLFFVISAFTIFYSLYTSDSSTYNFFIRRFFRIAPLYLIAVVTYAWIYGSGAVGIGLNLTFLHGFAPQYINSVVPGGWSIGVEMAFYCMIPFLFKKIRNLKAALYFFLLTLLFSFACMYLYRKGISSTPELESFVYFWLPNQLPVFALGFMVYFASFRNSEDKISGPFYPLLLFSFLIIFCLMTKFSIFGEHLVFGMSAALVIFLLKFKPLPRLVNKVTLFLGKISYSLYLGQYVAINLLQKCKVFSPLHEAGRISAIGNLAINGCLLLSVTALLAFTLYHIVELPFQKVGRTFLKKQKEIFVAKPAVGFDGVRMIATVKIGNAEG